MNHDRKSIDCNWQLNKFDFFLLAFGDLRVLDRTLRIVYIDFACAEFLESSAGSGCAHGDADGLLNGSEFLGNGFADREHGARSV